MSRLEQQKIEMTETVKHAYFLPVVRVSTNIETSSSFCSLVQFSYTTPRPFEAMSWVSSVDKSFIILMNEYISSAIMTME